jgi:hypothetical protein
MRLLQRVDAPPARFIAEDAFPLSNRSDASHSVANLLAVLRFLSVAVVVTLIVAVQPQEGRAPLLVFLLTGVAVLSLVFVFLGVRLSRVPVLAYPPLVVGAMVAE